MFAWALLRGGVLEVFFFLVSLVSWFGDWGLSRMGTEEKEGKERTP